MARNDETGGERLDISTRTLGSVLRRKLLVEEPERFRRTLEGWRCAPPPSYLVSMPLPTNMVLASRYDVKQGKKALMMIKAKKAAAAASASRR
jgi:hypothetical protein